MNSQRVKSLKQITKELLTAFDKDEIDEKAHKIISGIPKEERTPAKDEAAIKQAQEELITEAASTFNES